LEDAESLCTHANNSKVSENLRDVFSFPYTVEDAEFFIKNIASSKTNFILAIDIDGNAVGSIGIHPQADVHRKNAEIGYWLGEHFWGRGIVTEAVNTMVDFTFKNLDIHRVYASVFERNLASIRVLEKCGFIREAVHYKAIIKKDVIMDEFIYVKSQHPV
jgi:[ribosomal protein S5]-alanine N-acetyltransferase